ncbi:contractile injection system tape measure protein [Undibacterium sp. SXout7W]|uniref:contractile injection system tape measure protein n=1 Tax=Undibacterium sp. SXout7W TaxID=3413049 RepID=UPI003BF00F9F
MSAAIYRLTFDLKLTSTDAAHAVQRRISKFASHHLRAVLVEGMERFDRADRVFQFDQVVLDLGQVEEAELESQLRLRLKSALSDFFRSKLPTTISLQEIASADADNALSVRQNQQQSQLEAFLLGHTKNDDAPVYPDGLIQHALNNWPTVLVRQIQVLGQKQAVRKRLAQLKHSQVVAIVRLLAGNEAALVIDYARDVQTAHAKTPIVALSHREFASELWEFIFTFLLLDRGSYFNAKSLTESTLRQIAQRHQVSYKHLLTGLISCVQTLNLPASNHYALPQVLLELHSELEPADFSIEHRSPATLHELVARHADINRFGAGIIRGYNDTSLTHYYMDCIARFLEHGNLPWVLQQPARMPITEILALAIQADPDGLASLLRLYGKKKPARIRLCNQLSDPQIESLIELLVPQQASWIRRTLHKIRQIHQKKRLVQESSVRFAKILWEFVFHCLLVDHGSYFNTRSFVKSLLRQMATRYRLSYQTLLLEVFAHALTDRRLLLQQDSLPGILFSLKQELITESEAVSDASIRDSLPGAGQQIRNAMLEFLSSEQLLERGSHFNSRSYIDSLLHQLAARHGVSRQDLLAYLRTHLLLQGSSHQHGTTSTNTLSDILARIDDEARSDHASLTGGRISAESASDIAVAIALHFLQTGNIPKRTDAWPESGSEGQLRMDMVLTQPERLLAALKTADSDVMIARILQYFSSKQLSQLLRILAPAYAGFIETYLLTGIVLEADPQLTPSQRAQVSKLQWHAVLQFLSNQRTNVFSLNQFLADITKTMIKKLGLQDYHRSVTLIARQRASHEARFQPLVDLLDNVQVQSTSQPNADAATVVLEDSIHASPSTNTKKPPSPVDARYNTAPTWPHKITEGALMNDHAMGIYIQNGGQVILWPYLERYFQMLGLLNGKQFASFANQCRAVHLLQYLCTGSIDAPEHDVPLNKILCGIELDTALEVAGPASTQEQEISQQLLYTVTQHWEKLKNTSITGLRETFLIRNANLVKKPENWSLIVEHKSFDVLMGSLPFSIAMLRLPWMDGMLMVDWK